VLNKQIGEPPEFDPARDDLGPMAGEFKLKNPREIPGYNYSGEYIFLCCLHLNSLTLFILSL